MIIEQVMMRSLKSNGGLTRGRGVLESTCQLWLGSMHRSADIHNAVGELTGAYRTTSEQHLQLTPSRISRDKRDLTTIKEWFDVHEPFCENEPNFKSLSSGLIAGPDVNCDEAEEVGRNIQCKLNSMNMEDVSIKRNDKVRTFENLLPATKIGDKAGQISPSILFSRLTALVNFSDEIGENFCYELTPEPTSLFKHGMMRKPVKAVLRNHFLNTENSIVLENNDACVVGGGALLRKEVIDQYLAFMQRRYQKYGSVSVIFDGYSDEMSTKSQEHNRRMDKASASIQNSGNTKVTCSREVFLANPQNKDQLIKLLCTRFQEEGFVAMQSHGDADVLIVKTDVEYAESGKNVVVTADDTDILILMMNHWQDGMGEMFFSTEKKEGKRLPKLSYWRISDLSACDNPELLLFAHAWCGCDTTSAIHQKGTRSIVSYFKWLNFGTFCYMSAVEKA